MGQRPPESLRSDAQQNRERILRAAHDALAKAGDASLNSIAKAAGVGPATLYRHFPSREALVLAVYRHDVEELVESVPALLDERPPLEALRRWFERLASYVKIKQSLADVLHSATGEVLVSASYEPIIDAIAALLRACEEAACVRPGLDPQDVLLLMGFLWRTDSDEEGARRAERLLDLAIDGLRPSPTSPPRRWS